MEMAAHNEGADPGKLPEGGIVMAILTTKELQALSDQLDLEKVLHCKYLSAIQDCQEDALRGKLQKMADQHRQNYTTLLGYLK